MNIDEHLDERLSVLIQRVELTKTAGDGGAVRPRQPIGGEHDAAVIITQRVLPIRCSRSGGGGRRSAGGGVTPRARGGGGGPGPPVGVVVRVEGTAVAAGKLAGCQVLAPVLQPAVSAQDLLVDRGGDAEGRGDGWQAVCGEKAAS